jgi:NitT/TauT family transport system substrate-binding protein
LYRFHDISGGGSRLDPVKGWRPLRKLLATGLLLMAVLAAGCSSAGTVHHHQGLVKLPVGPPGTSASGVLRLGFLVDVPDAAAVVGSQMGFFQQDLGRVSLEAQPFTSAILEMTALEDGQLDAAYLDPVSAVMVSQAVHGRLRIVAGAAVGGTELVVRKAITRPSQLKGLKLAAPGGIQEATADSWLRRHGLPALTPAETAPSTDAGVLHEFRAGAIAGAWEPAPLDVEMAAAGGRVLATAANVWPAGSFPTVVLAVTDKYLTVHAAAVANLVKGQLQADKFLAANPVSAEAAFQQKMAQAEDAALPPSVLAESFAQVTFTDNPQEPEVRAEVQQAVAAGLVRPVTSWAAIFNLTELNSLLRSADRTPVNS